MKPTTSATLRLLSDIAFVIRSEDLLEISEMRWRLFILLFGKTNPVTGWKSVYVNPEFTKRIIGVTKDESDFILNYLFSLIHQNHDLQVRFKWNKNDVAIWDNRSNYHTATYDYERVLRVGDRVVSLGEKPYFDPKSKSRREYLGAQHSFNLGETFVQH
ncbi:hypothetical protein BN14_07436 [Rhizoctonia solani AG-1 IB]|uniref:TauD/TfdA-like domain-containing protein n=1 Tax=Thanatephorus cucumeris (strain AG1-IB / isolate 7/3/14) TaxID=1108050 RepID=M5C1N9_THACB|nr:hypothetical protein BN14_07436 [Rhizoctonia solani AG-1 IB]